MLASYDFVTPETLAYFTAAPEQAPRDVDFALAYVRANATTPEKQDAVLQALELQMRRALGEARRPSPRLCRAGARAALRLGAGAVTALARRCPAAPRPRRPPAGGQGARAAGSSWRRSGCCTRNATAVEVLRLCDGERTVAALVDELAARFAADRGRIAADVAALLTDLAAKRMVEL